MFGGNLLVPACLETELEFLRDQPRGLADFDLSKLKFPGNN